MSEEELKKALESAYKEICEKVGIDTLRKSCIFVRNYAKFVKQW